jgi:sigma-B regulation protein RsbU (phosphoserine phosphatase)
VELEELRKASFLQVKLSALHRELEIASKIQLSSLPSKFPAFPGRTDLDLYAMMIPAQEVGGDFYDFFLIDDDRLAFLLGDVSGKGIGAALFMAITRTLIRATGLQGLAAAECLGHVNRVLFPETMPRMFVTAIYGILDTRTGEVSFCNAGHQTPLIVRRDGRVESTERTGGLGLCLVPEFGYREGKLMLEKGDRLLLYTDGVTEAVNGIGEQFDDERLIECLAESRDEGPSEMIRDILRSVTGFSGGLTQSDDITMLALQYNGQ